MLTAFSRVLVLVAAAAAVPAPAARPSPAPAAPATDDGARAKAFVAAFYAWYEHSGRPLGESVVLRANKDALSPELHAALKADLEASARVKDEVVGLDFDPFLNTQEASEPFDAGTAVAKGDSWWVPLTDRKSHVLRVTAEVTCAAAGCRIANLHYPAQELPENENLVSILKVLARDRAKAATAAKAPADAKRSRK